MLWDTYGGYQGAERTLLDAFGIYPAGWGDFTYILQADENNQVYLANTSDNYKEFLKFMKKLWDEGIIDQEAFTAVSRRLQKLRKTDMASSVVVLLRSY